MNDDSRLAHALSTTLAVGFASNDLAEAIAPLRKLLATVEEIALRWDFGALDPFAEGATEPGSGEDELEP